MFVDESIEGKLVLNLNHSFSMLTTDRLREATVSREQVNKIIVM